jgi:hypothetical protein
LALYVIFDAFEQAIVHGHASTRRACLCWNDELAAGRDMWWSPTIRAAVTAGMPWLDVYCPGCQTSRAIDIRTIDRHPLSSVGSLVLGLRCSWCHGLAPMPVIRGLHRLPPAAITKRDAC